MFEYQHNILADDKSIKYYLYQEDEPLTFSQFIDLLRDDETFRSFLMDLLSDVPFRAYHWETPPITTLTLDQPFEFVVSRSPAIDLPPDVGPFAQYFNKDDEVSVFDNLGGDAKLVAPAPTDTQRNYSHIGVFTEQAPDKQQQALWKRVGAIAKKEISDQPLWLNTAGGGVAWLHVRLDSAPKYYRHRPYVYLDG